MYLKQYNVIEARALFSLDDYLQASQILKEDKIVSDVMIQIIDIVSFLHSNNVYHGDIKP
jgi:serine/threonine protein kinase